MRVSRGVMSTASRSSPGAPCRKTTTPLMATSTSSGSKGQASAGTVPSWARTLPQFGSPPATAHLRRLEADTARAAASAAASLTAPETVMAMSWVAPSASATRRRPRRARSSVRAPPSSAGEGRAPEAPEASSRTVSLVDMQPSELIRLTVRATAPPRAARAAAASTTASVVMTHSMVARPGASMPTPLIMPPALQATPSAVRETASSLGTVSVVMMARAASWPASGVGASAPAARPAPARRVGMSRGTPMTPVEHTRTRPGSTPRSPAARAAVASVSRRPWAPVQALAPPELRTTARARPGWPPS